MANINREELLKDIEETVLFSGRPGHISAEMRGANKVIDRIKRAKALSGEWEKVDAIFFDNEVVYYKCPLCNTTWESKTKYCPGCGADMRGDKNG